MKKEHTKAYLKFRKALKEKDTKGIKMFIQAWFSINEWSILLPILQEVINDWKEIEKETKESEAYSKRLLGMIDDTKKGKR